MMIALCLFGTVLEAIVFSAIAVGLDRWGERIIEKMK